MAASDATKNDRYDPILDKLKISELEVIGQSADKSIIFFYHTKARRIICFDQHAVDERIRYEKILDAKLSKTDLIDEGDLDQIKSKACHGAIRVGDKLTLFKCYNIMKQLLACKVPYRCAHSRNNVAILQNLDTILVIDRLRRGFPLN